MVKGGFSNPNPITHTGDLTIGAALTNTGTPYQPFKGVIDEVKIFRKQLTDQEVLSEVDEYLNNGLVAYYSFDDGTATDMSGNQNDGLLLYGVDCTQPGVFGNSCSFDGIDDFINIPSSVSLTPTNEMTWSMWIKKPDREDGILLRKGYSFSSSPYIIKMPGYDNVNANFYDGSAATGFSTSGNTIPSDVWVHVALTYDGTEIVSYVNGEFDKKTSWGTGRSLFNAAGPLLIGADYSEAGAINNEYEGLIDEVRIYNKVLSQETI